MNITTDDTPPTDSQRIHSFRLAGPPMSSSRRSLEGTVEEGKVQLSCWECGTLPPIIMVQWKMVPSNRILTFQMHPFSTSMILGGRVWIFGAHDVIDFFDFSDFSEIDDFALIVLNIFFGEHVFGMLPFSMLGKCDDFGA